MTLNLHSLVRGAISSVHPEVKATLYRASGQNIGPGGKVMPDYAPGEAITAQVQSEGPSVLAQVDRVGQEEVSRKLYLFSEPDLEHKVGGIVRPLSRGGDMIQFEDETWWLVEAVIEDFSRSGWASVRATLQVKAPAGLSPAPGSADGEEAPGSSAEDGNGDEGEEEEP
jgi:hypothetical protein